MSEINDANPASASAPLPRTAALRKVVEEIEVGAASLGWDRPPSIYALVPTHALLQEPDVPDDIRESLENEWDGTESHLSAILQDTISDDVEEVLPKLAWPDTVVGAALTVERLTVPPEVEAQVPDDPDEALAFISSHPSRADLRLTIGVTRERDTWCALRTRALDDPQHVVKGENLVPVLVEALQFGFLPDEDFE